MMNAGPVVTRRLSHNCEVRFNAKTGCRARPSHRPVVWGGFKFPANGRKTIPTRAIGGDRSRSLGAWRVKTM
jgi:hypothetical protein